MFSFRQRQSDESSEQSMRMMLAEAIFEHSLSACFLLRGGKIAECNPALIALVGGTREKLIGMGPDQISPRVQPDGQESAVGVQKRLEELFRTNRPVCFDWMHQALDGSPLPVRVTLFTVVLAGRKEVASVWEDRRDQHAAQQRQKEVDEAVRHVRHSFSQALAEVSEGNLGVRISEAFPKDYEEMRQDFNQGIARLHDAMLNVTDHTRKVRDTSAEVVMASDDLARRTEEQAASLAQAVATIGTIAAGVRGMARDVKSASEAALSSHDSAEKSKLVVSEAMNAMTKIADSSRQIASIVGMIEKIAFQTNILALNASVEAARAGETGRGFAVVANEVRVLAQQSSEAVKNIRDVIAVSRRTVDDGVTLVNNTGEMLADIVRNVAVLNATVGNISVLSHQQADGLNEVNQTMGQIDDITQKNAAMVEETTAASHSLAQEASSLNRIVSRFETRKQGTLAKAG
ncbi:methyl-accepting chemotaxis protein [Gluconacetobacter takamatsuzukensis]|uniref:Methyl-accepting chemotaxis protein n=1 Tax=Gluconacetobacter takamatsuzukensis TaxID=1286190 RepID=A0A7W4PN29_9PROT|nr:methyl-accepting chemotaxis protein [Gluconacetobacter takamatsuzukensis]MBB2204172.1 methyl-accepting chemotaxis protein [Gluconacetobacter takamatsuzukensis]